MFFLHFSLSPTPLVIFCQSLTVSATSRCTTLESAMYMDGILIILLIVLVAAFDKSSFYSFRSTILHFRNPKKLGQKPSPQTCCYNFCNRKKGVQISEQKYDYSISLVISTKGSASGVFCQGILFVFEGPNWGTMLLTSFPPPLFACFCEQQQTL